MSAEGSGRAEVPWNDPSAPNRISPRRCVEAARADMDKAWQTGDWRAAVIHLRGALDWLRRAIEQMAREAESDAP
jgi:hypothetical protein